MIVYLIVYCFVLCEDGDAFAVLSKVELHTIKCENWKLKNQLYCEICKYFFKQFARVTHPTYG